MTDSTDDAEWRMHRIPDKDWPHNLYGKKDKETQFKSLDEVDKNKLLKELDDLKLLAYDYYNLISDIRDLTLEEPSEERNTEIENKKERLKEIIGKMLIY